MDIISIIQAVFRRWYVSVPLIVLGGAAALYVQLTTPPVYEAAGQVLVADPSLDPSGLPTTIVDIDELLRTLDEESVRAELATGDSTYQLELEDPTSLSLVVRSTNDDDAVATLEAVAERFRQDVDTAQSDAGIPRQERLQARGGDRWVIGEVSDSIVEAVTTLSLFDPTAGIANPFGASNSTVRLLVVSVQSDAAKRRIADLTGPDIEYRLAQSASDAAPILSITTTGPEQDAVLDAFDQVQRVVDEELQRRQERAEIASWRRTRLETIARPEEVTDISPPLDRAAAAVFALGGLLAVAGAIAVDSALTQRRLARPDQAPPAQTGSDPIGVRHHLYESDRAPASSPMTPDQRLREAEGG